MNEEINQSDFLFYRGEDGNTHVQVILGDETVWISQKGMAEVFDVGIPTINEHLQNIFKTNELVETSVIRKIRITASDGKGYLTMFYNIEAIIAVGYRVNSYKATRFRQWATRILSDYLIKGFVLDDERLKQGNKLFGKDYFKELLERIREIRASERMFYEKITDLYATSADYDKNDPVTHKFFAKVQNKLEFAIVGKTSAEIIKSRADATMPNMNLKTWKNAGRQGKIQKSDVTIAKNYLNEDELRKLNTLVNMYLDYAELQVERHRVMKMEDWSKRLDAFLDFNEYEVLENLGRVRKNTADAFAENEYIKFRVSQDFEFKSDFNEIIDNIINIHSLPKEQIVNKQEVKEPNFDDTLKKVLNVPPPLRRKFKT